MFTRRGKMAALILASLLAFLALVGPQDLRGQLQLLPLQAGPFVPNLVCYRIQHQLPQPATFNVTDQFGTLKEVSVQVLLLLCEPAAKIRPSTNEDQGAPPKVLPLTCYEILNPSDALNRRIALTDQFAKGQETTVGAPLFFCDPTTLKIKRDATGAIAVEQAKPKLPHFTCYRIDPLQVSPDRIKLRDQFGEIGFFTISTAEVLCEPAQKWHPGEREPRPESFAKSPVLKCYNIPPDQAQPLNRPVVVADQFDFMLVTVLEPVLFCDRSLKEVFPAAGRGDAPAQPLKLVRAQALYDRSREFVTFQAQGAGIELVEVRVFDLAGRSVFASGPMRGSNLSWNLLNQRGTPVANGIYLYVVTVQGQDQTSIHSAAKKLLVLR